MSELKYLDLHVHSCFSDGRDTPEELIARAAEPARELAAVALTDHDTTDGIPRFLTAAAAHPELQAIPGIELGARYADREIHLIGLFVPGPGENPGFDAFLEDLREGRRARLKRMLEKLASLGYPLNPESLGELSSAGRPHVARGLLERYPEKFSSLRDVFDKLLKNRAPGYVPRDLPEPGEVIRRLHAAGAPAIWAHPVYRNRNERVWLRRMLKKLIPMGLDGLECYYSLFGPEETALVSEFIAEFGLLGSGGSDCHGEPGIELGLGGGKLRIPETLLPPLLEKSREIRRNNLTNPGMTGMVNGSLT